MPSTCEASTASAPKNLYCQSVRQKQRVALQRGRRRRSSKCYLVTALHEQDHVWMLLLDGQKLQLERRVLDAGALAHAGERRVERHIVASSAGNWLGRCCLCHITQLQLLHKAAVRLLIERKLGLRREHGRECVAVQCGRVRSKRSFLKLQRSGHGRPLKAQRARLGRRRLLDVVVVVHLQLLLFLLLVIAVVVQHQVVRAKLLIIIVAVGLLPAPPAGAPATAFLLRLAPPRRRRRCRRAWGGCPGGRASAPCLGCRFGGNALRSGWRCVFRRGRCLALARPAPEGRQRAHAGSAHSEELGQVALLLAAAAPSLHEVQCLWCNTEHSEKALCRAALLHSAFSNHLSASWGGGGRPVSHTASASREQASAPSDQIR